MLILITWKLSHISEFTRVLFSALPLKKDACIVFYANLSWFRFQWVCADARKMFAHANESEHLSLLWGEVSEWERDERRGRRHRKWKWGKLPLFFPKNIFLQSHESSYEIIFIKTVTHVTFYMLSVRLSVEKLLHPPFSSWFYDFKTFVVKIYF